MPDYYTLKRLAIKDIEELMKQRTPLDSIKLTIFEKYGFGDNMIKKYLALLEARRIVEFRNDEVGYEVMIKEVKEDEEV